jgi:DNA-binding MarR family transcriptional regulator
VSDAPGNSQDRRADPGSLIPEILGLLSVLSDKFEPGAGEMKQWMARNIANPAVAELLHDTTILGLRTLDAIGRLEPVNGITISKQFGIPKGSVSKITRRLIARNLVTKTALPNNKKEVLFQLTPLGKELFVAHRAFDRQMEQGFVQFLGRYNADELGLVARMLRDLSVTSWLGLKTTLEEPETEPR